jgi:hypothetical protein
VDLRSLQTDPILTNVSVQYRNPAFIADLIFPEVPVDAQTGKYFKFGKDNLRPQDDSKRPGGMANEADFTLSQEDYNAEGHSLRFFIPDPWRKSPTGGVDLDVDTTIQLTDRLQLNQDINLFKTVSGGGVPLVDVNAGGALWDDPDVDPITRIDQEKQALAKKGKMPNALVLSRPVFTGVRNNRNVKARITGAPGLEASKISAQQLASVLEIDTLIVADVVKNQSAEGQADDLDFVWGKTALLFYRPTTPAVRTVSLGYHFVWRTGVNGQLVRRYRNEDRESDVIEPQKYYDQKIVCSDAGTFFENCVS